MHDLFSPRFKANPFPLYAHLRESEPVYCHVAPYGAHIWYITRYEDVAAVLKDNERFTKIPPYQKRPGSQTGGVSVFHMINRNMLFADPPDHTRLRRLVSQAFTPRRIEQLTPRIGQIAKSLVDNVYTNKKMDFIADFAFPLPVQVIMEMLGIPLADREDVLAWSQAIIAPGRHGITLKERKQHVRAFVAYLEKMFTLRAKRPEDDLISALVAAEEGGDRLNAAELSSMVALLFVTGHETVVNLLGNGLLVLLQHPQVWEDLRHNPQPLPAVIEELLRIDGPVETSTTRWAAVDLTFHGHQIKAGDTVRVVLTSANRDGRVFEAADQFLPQREHNPHLAFGLGIHYCLGAPLARLEGRIALQTLLDTLPHLTLAHPPSDLEWHTGVIFRGLKTLPLKW